MNGGGRERRWKNLKQRLGFKGMGCCGATWSFTASNMSIRDEEIHIQEQHGDEQELIINNNDTTTTTVGQIPVEIITGSYNVGQIPAASSGMNLATALAAERNLRETLRGPVKSLKRLIEESDGVYWKKRKEGEREGEEGQEGFDGVCCVCMERNKGAAFIPCGHTFCRVCSREVWVNRGTCPICNRSILDILDIF